MGLIHLVRHAAVENPGGVIYGRLPGFQLSERGRQQARAAAQWLEDRDVGLVVSSPLERARETAGIIAAPHGLDVVVDERVTESETTLEGAARNLGSLLRDPRNWWRLRNPFRPSWGERFSEIRARMMAAIEQHVRDAGDRDLVVVSHQTPVVVARMALTGTSVPPWLGYRTCETGSVMSIRYRGGTAVVDSYFRG